MSEKSYLSKPKMMEDELAKAAVGATCRGLKKKSGLFFKLTIGMGLLAIICTLAIPNPKDQLKEDILEIEKSYPDRINAGKLATIFNNQNAAMNDQSQINESEIIGKIVEWELEILVVARLPCNQRLSIDHS